MYEHFSFEGVLWMEEEVPGDKIGGYLAYIDAEEETTV